jgi:hypothetical protein
LPGSERGRAAQERAQRSKEPLELAEALQRLGALDPATLDALVREQHAEAAHERAMELRDKQLERLGLVLGFILGVMYFSASLWLGIIGHPWPSAAALGAGGLVGLVRLFVPRK